MHLQLVTLLVRDYDRAIAFFQTALGFQLVTDEPARTSDGRPKRWVEMRPAGAASGLLLARSDGADQDRAVGNQVAGRVGFFLKVDEFDEALSKLIAADDCEGNAWDLIGPNG